MIKELFVQCSRGELEMLAMAAVSPEEHYDLADNLDSTTEDELWKVIEAGEIPEKQLLKYYQAMKDAQNYTKIPEHQV